jgi:ACS family hexuronate transporter-like MFS transporter
MMKRNLPYYWIIVAMALIATSLSFLDRQVLSILIIRIKEDLGVTNVGYGFINTGFLIGYAIMFTIGGMLIDRYGSRLGLAVSVGFWSFATLLHSFAQNIVQLGMFRFLLGVGEGGAFPGAVKSVTEWVPEKKHALANGIAIGGAAFGAVLAPPLCAYLVNITGWRGVFIITGMVGFSWTLIWLLVTRNRNSSNENGEFKADHAPGANTKLSAARSRIDLHVLLKAKEVWVFILMRFLLDPILYFYMFWIPKYLNETFGSSIDQIGRIFWIPFLAMGVSNMLGGWISDKIYAAKGSLNMARKLIMGASALMMLPVLFTIYAGSPAVVILIVTVAFFAHGLWITNYVTSISDIFGKKVTSTVVGLSGTAGAVSAFILNPVIGLIITGFSYSPMWIYSGTMYITAFVFFAILIPKIRLSETFA